MGMVWVIAVMTCKIMAISHYSMVHSPSLGKELAMLPRLMKKWILTFIVAFWRMISKDLSSYSRRSAKMFSFSRIMIPSIRASKQYLGSKTTKSMSWTG
jgi:hypothetical protein